MSSPSKMAFSQTKERVKLTYFREVQQEFTKVSWTNKEELVFCTKMVIGASFFLGMGIYIVDLVIRGALGSIEMIARFLGG